MGSLLLALLPLAVGMAANPVPIVGVIAMLSTDRPLRNGALYVITMVVVVMAIGAVSLLVLNDALGVAGSSGSSGGLQLAIGLAFLVIAYLQWRAKPAPVAPGESVAEPGWMKMIDKGGPYVAVVLGLALVNYALVTGAVSDILKAHLSNAAGLAAVAIFAAMALSTEWVPYVGFVVDRPRSEQLMERVRGTLIAHNRVILMWVFIAMGAVYVAKGLVSLL